MGCQLGMNKSGHCCCDSVGKEAGAAKGHPSAATLGGVRGGRVTKRESGERERERGREKGDEFSGGGTAGAEPRPVVAADGK